VGGTTEGPETDQIWSQSTSTLQRASGDLSAPRFQSIPWYQDQVFRLKGLVPVDFLARELQLRGGTIGGAYRRTERLGACFFDLLCAGAHSDGKDFQSD